GSLPDRKNGPTGRRGKNAVHRLSKNRRTESTMVKKLDSDRPQKRINRRDARGNGLVMRIWAEKSLAVGQRNSNQPSLQSYGRKPWRVVIFMIMRQPEQGDAEGESNRDSKVRGLQSSSNDLFSSGRIHFRQLCSL